ncbi:thioesterase family protein [Actinacidiphila glaucinigra]|uniref:acyl-CoA thioesterase n=1 Tax=Actinacidiphila glaucinigra TaxID=235986 RepID=UPI002DD902E6|nr:thioesterase family protein [Actinacidiphila glaucinigra]WSD60122.1 thioesterase family protein [Actinacidiphila glaucinigra]
MPGSITDTETADATGTPRPADDGTIRIDRSWWSWNGAQGGHVAALALTAMRDDLAARTGERLPVRTLGAHFLAPVDERPLRLAATTLREGRRSSVSSVTALQDDSAVLTGAAVFGRSEPGPVQAGTPAPVVPGPDACPPLTLPRSLAAFAAHLEIRPADDARPLAGGARAELTAWMRFADGRPLDPRALVVLADALPPALFAVWTEPRPVPTAELTVHFTDVLDTAPAEGWALVRSRTEHAGGGWAVEDSALWTEDGRLLALARQARAVRDFRPGHQG